MPSLQHSLRKPIDFHWFKNVLLELFGLQLCLFFFDKMTKFYNNISSAWVGQISGDLFFLQNGVIYVVKIQQKYLWSIATYFHGFLQTVHKHLFQSFIPSPFSHNGMMSIKTSHPVIFLISSPNNFSLLQCTSFFDFASLFWVVLIWPFWVKWIIFILFYLFSYEWK